MLASEAARTFEAMKEDLMKSFPGQYALVCGQRLVGVFKHVDDAMGACSRLFDQDGLPPGTPILISEIALQVSVRVFATPFRRVAPAAGLP
ncbi:MAG TPA: hypothetical protein VHL80_04230 [Polyangia bacterium]|nr:hypothetical protein [Polyangia bacterium]